MFGGGYYDCVCLSYVGIVLLVVYCVRLLCCVV